MPHVDPSTTTDAVEPPLLAVDDQVSEVRVIDGLSELEGLKGKVFDFVGKRLKRESERQLRKHKRWSDAEALVLHLEIKHIRLRKNAAVLLIWQVAGVDEMGIRLWFTRRGEVVASAAVNTVYDAAGGIYGTNSNQRRLEMLADQAVRKMVKRL